MTDLKTTLLRVLQEIEQEAEQRSYCQPIPCNIDHQLSALIGLFLKAHPPERQQFFSLVSSSFSGLLISFAERMASLGVTEKSRVRLLEGLIALVLEDYRGGDPKDNIMILPLLYHAAEKIGADARELFSEAASYASNKAARQILDFPQRNPRDKSLDAFFYEEIDGADGFRYKQKEWWRFS